ncbi:MAG: PEP-CTERM sorting domain-containing protein, partial [Planctomycetes bacterium]|nr:PEP-CTERM sorting domain-containing protein [Planctomycetota bacterium]
DTFQELGVTWTIVPAPGAMALLGLAGLAGRRRRR